MAARETSAADGDRALLGALEMLRQRGPIGERSLTAAIEHADRFVALIPQQATRLVDLGSGGGLPGLVIAVRRRTLDVILVERRQTRADLLRRAVAALNLPRCTVEAVDVQILAGRLATEQRLADVATARSFADPPTTARWGAAVLRSGGKLLVSAPPSGDEERWPSSLLDRFGLLDRGLTEGIRCLERR